MNNRKIAKIAAATTTWCNKEFTTYWIDDPEKYVPIWNKKFAELIAKECATICRERGKGQSFGISDEIDEEREHCAEEIEAYFGVK